MNFDPGQISQLLGSVHFPISKADIIQQAKQHGANDQITSMLNRLPDKTFNSPQDIQSSIGGLGNPGGGGFKL